MSVLDLCGISDVRLRLGIASGLGNSSQTSIVNTTVSATINPGVQTVSPASIANIGVGMILQVDGDSVNAELVTVTAVGATTFTATFANTHTYSSTPIPIEDSTDHLIGDLITSASLYILRRTGRGPSDSSVPAASPLNSIVTYNEWYDGTGNDKLFLRNYPIQTVTSLTISGSSIPASTGWGTVGYVIDGSGRALAFQGSGDGGYRWSRGYSSYPYASRGSLWGFSRGTQNINVQYTAGYAATPPDLLDACVQLVAFNWRRRDWLGMKQVTQPQSEGTITYNSDWIVPPNVHDVILDYTRRSTT